VLKGKHIVIGITGSIAAYKIPFLVRMLIKEGAEVQVIMTPVAKDFVTPLTLSTLSLKPVIIDPFSDRDGTWNNHVELGQWADLVLFAPVTANTLGKMAHGIADNFLVTAYLSAKCPVMIAPAMDLDMYAHPSTKRNIEILRSYGNLIIEPQVGELASGLTGPGRLEEPGEIFAIIERFFRKKDQLAKKKVLITAGPTQESIDPVRYISNRSSGLMGLALAKEAVERGATVTLISGPLTATIPPDNMRHIGVTTAHEMHDECMKHAGDSDIIIMAAAVADFTPLKPSEKKLKKNEMDGFIELQRTVDILAALGASKRSDQLLVGFALETDQEIKNALLKLRTKNLDFIVLNSLQDSGAGFGTSTNKVTIIDKNGRQHPGTLKSKTAVAEDIFNIILDRTE